MSASLKTNRTAAMTKGAVGVFRTENAKGTMTH